MSIRLQPVFIITRREVRDQFRDWRIIFPVVILTLFFPILMNITANILVSYVQKYGGQAIIYERLIPFLLMIVGFFPITVSLVIALESFAGETERRSIEPLLSTPLADWQLYFGKLLASMVPPLLASYFGVFVYLVGVYIQLGWSAPPVLFVQIMILTTVQALVMVSGAVVVSTQTTSVRAANLLASFIIIPMALLMQGESLIMFWGQYEVLWLAILGQIVVAILLVRTGIAHFSREGLLGRNVDVLNLRWGWRVFKSAFVGQAHSVKEWYRIELPQTLRRLIIPGLMMVFFLGMAVWLGVRLASGIDVDSTPAIRKYLESLKSTSADVDAIPAVSVVSVLGVFFLWLYNLRGVAASTFLGMFSCGILGVLALMVTIIVLGFIAALTPQVGLPWWLYLEAHILPHGILEIPAMILAGAAVLRMGATMITPSQGETIGEAWLRALGDWARVTVALVLPLFLLAAFLETFVTPHIAAWLLGP
jgi:uncharacterized membrane protein SpoIIM required for sporulation/ABC-type transport system involved in multi-copper enzyme maturation permease subunit